jgi:hypothetical protein
MALRITGYLDSVHRLVVQTEHNVSEVKGREAQTLTVSQNEPSQSAAIDRVY